MELNQEQFNSILNQELAEKGIPEEQAVIEPPAETPEPPAEELAGHDDEPELEAEPAPVEGEAEGESPPEPVEAELPQDITSLAEAIGTEASYLYGVKVKLADDGEEVPIGELKDRLQESRREIDKLKAHPAPETPAPVISQTQQDLNDINRAHQQLEQGWIQYQQSEDWQKLSQDEPSKALLAMQQYQLQKQQLEGYRNQAAQKLREEQKALLDGMAEYIPSWKDAETREAEIQGIKSALAEAGVNPKRIAAETDQALVAVLQEWWKMKQKPAPKPSPSGLKPLIPKAAPKNAQKPSKEIQMKRAQKMFHGAKTPEQKARALNKILGA